VEFGNHKLAIMLFKFTSIFILGLLQLPLSFGAPPSGNQPIQPKPPSGSQPIPPKPPSGSEPIQPKPLPHGPVKFDLILTWGPISPNGHSRYAILSNNQFPGPTLELQQGDSVEFMVHNNLPFSTAVHFHGIDQNGTPWSDGVPGLSQKPIDPGQSFLYKWTATDYGTYFYHAHSRSQIMDGLYGPIIIKSPGNEPTAFTTISNNKNDVRAMLAAEANPNTMLVSDWISFSSAEVEALEQETGVDYICVDSILINGKGQENCLPQDQINSLTTPALAPILSGTTMTAKG
jgi:Multicopper oxidase